MTTTNAHIDAGPPTRPGQPGHRTPEQLRGAWGEDAAAAHARALGARILVRNVTSPWGEVDLVLLERGVVAFGEVKTRRGPSAWGTGREAVGRKKRERLARTARHVLTTLRVDVGRVPYRFDIFEVHPSPAGPLVTWIRDAFEVNLS